MNDLIIAAINEQNLTFFKNLHDDGYDFTQNGSEILRKAASYGKPEVVACVVPWSDAQTRNNEPLVVAAQAGCIESLRILIPYSSSVFRAIMTACAFGNHHCVAELAPHAVFTTDQIGVVFNNLLGANMLNGVEHLIPLVDVRDVYSRLDPEYSDLFADVLAKYEKKILTASVGDIQSGRKVLKI